MDISVFLFAAGLCSGILIGKARQKAVSKPTRGPDGKFVKRNK